VKDKQDVRENVCRELGRVIRVGITHNSPKAILDRAKERRRPRAVNWVRDLEGPVIHEWSKRDEYDSVQ
jgi:hypothetical protein